MNKSSILFQMKKKNNKQGSTETKEEIATMDKLETIKHDLELEKKEKRTRSDSMPMMEKWTEEFKIFPMP